MTYAVVERRGALVGAVAAGVYGGIALVAAVSPGSALQWSGRHPLADGALLGPLLFFGLAGATPLPLTWCLSLGVVGALTGTALARRRIRRQPTT